MKERKAARDGILADFQFYIDDRSQENFEGLSMNISPVGFCFLTETSIKEGQTITITKQIGKSTTPDFAGQRATVIWVKKRRNYIEAGAKLIQTVETGRI